MKKHYGQITKTYMRVTFIAALLLIIGGISVYITNSASVTMAEIAASVEIAAGIILFILIIILKNRRKDSISNYLNIIAKNSNSISANLMGSFPIPVVVAHIDGSIFWYNEKFSELFFNQDLFDTKIGAVISDIKWGEILKSASQYEKRIRLGDMKYLFIANTIKNRHITSSEDEDKVSVYIYLIDKTAETELKKMYDNDKTDIAIINIDNYEDVLQRVNDNEQQYILSRIRQFVNEWAMEGNALLKNTDRDRYYEIGRAHV